MTAHRLAYAASLIFVLASGATNALYGWSKGTDVLSSTVWCAVSIAASAVFALSWPALLRATTIRSAVISIAALLVCGSYSTIAALGSAATAERGEQSATNVRQMAQAAYAQASAELAGIKPARPVEEVEVALRQAQRDPHRFACAFVNGSLAISCPRLDGELARARARGKAQAAMDKAASTLSSGTQHGPPDRRASLMRWTAPALGIECHRVIVMRRIT